MPEFLIPTISEAPIAPIKLKLGVASNSVSINTLTLSPSKNKNRPNKGDNKIIGMPVKIQWAVILDKISKGSE